MIHNQFNIPGYEFISEISRGPLTSVMICRQKLQKRKVVLKVLHPQYAQDVEIKKRFTREANLYAKLKHPNIVEVLDLGEINGFSYIALQYIEGWSLDRFIRSFQPISHEIAIGIICCILQGIIHAHQKRIVHRDIKPSNILVDKSGHVLIADFGLARPVDMTAITEQGNIIGTPSYMAPELLRAGTATEISDIFSLGVTFYELVTGKNPFKATSIPESIQKILNSEVDAIPEQPPWLNRLLLTMVAKEPEARPQSAKEILETIDVQIQHTNPEYYTPKLMDFISQRGVQPLSFPDHRTGRRKIRQGFSIFLAAAVLLIIVTVFWVVRSGTEAVVSDPPGAIISQKENPMSETDIRKNTKVTKPVPAPTIPTMPVKAIQSPVRIEEVKEESELPRTGELYLAVEPWAEVFIDGDYKDTTPLKNTIILDTGQHVVELRNPAFNSFQTALITIHDQTETLYVRLQPLFGSLDIAVIPWGEIYIDQEYVDTTPIQKPLQLKEGRYQLMIKNPHYKTYTEPVEILAGKTKTLKINLTE